MTLTPALIRRIREAAGLSQSEMAGRLGMAKDSLARLERGRHRPRDPDRLLGEMVAILHRRQRDIEELLNEITGYDR